MGEPPRLLLNLCFLKFNVLSYLGVVLTHCQFCSQGARVFFLHIEKTCSRRAFHLNRDCVLLCHRSLNPLRKLKGEYYFQHSCQGLTRERQKYLTSSLTSNIIVPNYYDKSVLFLYALELQIVKVIEYGAYIYSSWL